MVFHTGLPPFTAYSQLYAISLILCMQRDWEQSSEYCSLVCFTTHSSSYCTIYQQFNATSLLLVGKLLHGKHKVEITANGSLQSDEPFVHIKVLTVPKKQPVSVVHTSLLATFTGNREENSRGW